MLLVVPFAASAQSITIPFSGDQLVSRGDFLRAAVRSFDLTDEPVSSAPLPFLRVPAAYEPFVRVGHEFGALSIFGNDLTAAFPITRGEAAFIVAELKNLAPQTLDQFRDIRSSDVDKTIAAVVAKGWISSLTDNYFGSTRRIVGDHARDLLLYASGQASSSPIEVTLLRQVIWIQTQYQNLIAPTACHNKICLNWYGR